MASISDLDDAMHGPLGRAIEDSLHSSRLQLAAIIENATGEACWPAMALCRKKFQELGIRYAR